MQGRAEKFLQGFERKAGKKKRPLFRQKLRCVDGMK
jgi:hypothetical protein